jgi:vacuolar protein sorting-associated protein VTA1
MFSWFQFKTTNNTNEAITSEVVGQAHMENYALKVFLFADNEDRASRFNKYNIVLCTVVSLFLYMYIAPYC